MPLRMMKDSRLLPFTAAPAFVICCYPCQLGVGENFGVGGAFAKWGAASGSAQESGGSRVRVKYNSRLSAKVPVTPRNFVRLLQRNEALLGFNKHRELRIRDSEPRHSAFRGHADTDLPCDVHGVTALRSVALARRSVGGGPQQFYRSPRCAEHGTSR